MTHATIDLAAFRDLQETAGAEFVRDLVRTFLEEAPGMFADLRGAYGAGEADRFRRAAHSLKSNGLSFGAVGFGAMARELELAGLDKVRQGGEAALAALEELSHA
jgi:HPt (histidine-containing phosphotransfer) domain-containing protein